LESGLNHVTRHNGKNAQELGSQANNKKDKRTEYRLEKTQGRVEVGAGYDKRAQNCKKNPLGTSGKEIKKGGGV